MYITKKKSSNKTLYLKNEQSLAGFIFVACYFHLLPLTFSSRLTMQTLSLDNPLAPTQSPGHANADRREGRDEQLALNWHHWWTNSDWWSAAPIITDQPGSFFLPLIWQQEGLSLPNCNWRVASMGFISADNIQTSKVLVENSDFCWWKHSIDHCS